MSNKIKVLQLLASNSFSGAENVVCQIIDMFKNNVEMVYCSPSGQINEMLKSKGIPYIPLKKLSISEVSRAIQYYKPNIIHAHDIKASIIAAKVAKKIPVVSHIHGSDALVMGKLSLKSFLFYLSSLRLKHIFWVSKSCLDVYKFKNKVYNKSSVLYNIISLDALKDKAELECANSYDIAYLGRLEPVKDPIRMLNIIKDCVEINKNIKCVIMGDGSLKHDCEKFVNENGLSSNVKFLGFISNPQSVLKNCKVMLMSSITEGTPMCVLESLGLGVPVVSTPTDGMVDLIKNGENGFLYTENDVAVSYITNILQNPGKMKENCLVFSKNYNNQESYKNAIMDIYNKVIFNR